MSAASKINTNLYHALRHWVHRLRALTRPEKAPDAAGYVIFHAARAGSTVLTDQLQQHPQIFAAEEMALSHRKIHWFRKENMTAKTPTMTSVSPRWVRWLCPHKGYLSALVSDMRRRWRNAPPSASGEERLAYGFEFLRVDADLFGFSHRQAVEFFSRRGLDHFIFLERRNVLRKRVSTLLALANGMFNLAGDNTLAHYRPTLSVRIHEGPVAGRLFIDGHLHYRSFLEQLDAERFYNEDMHRYLDDARRRGERWLHLIYEDDIEQSPKVAYEKVCAFLGMEAVEVECNIKRLNPKPLSEIIENYDEVREYLRGTRYEAMLES